MVGCSSVSEIVPYGKESYILSVEDVFGIKSAGALQINAAQKAKEYCNERGKDFVIINSNGQASAYTTSSASLQFSCISKVK